MRHARLKEQENQKRIRAKRTRHNIKKIQAINYLDHEASLDRLHY